MSFTMASTDVSSLKKRLAELQQSRRGVETKLQELNPRGRFAGRGGRTATRGRLGDRGGPPGRRGPGARDTGVRGRGFAGRGRDDAPLFSSRGSGYVPARARASAMLFFAQQLTRVRWLQTPPTYAPWRLAACNRSCAGRAAALLRPRLTRSLTALRCSGSFVRNASRSVATTDRDVRLALLRPLWSQPRGSVRTATRKKDRRVKAANTTTKMVRREVQPRRHVPRQSHLPHQRFGSGRARLWVGRTNNAALGACSSARGGVHLVCESSDGRVALHTPRLFGALMGHLQRAKKDMEKSKETLAKRKEVCCMGRRASS